LFALNGKSDGYGRSGSDAGCIGCDGCRFCPAALPAQAVPLCLSVLFQGNVNIPRHAGTVGMLGFLGATGLYGMAVGGHTPEVIKATASTLGFAIEDVKVVGNNETSDIDILGQLDLDGETSLVGLSAEEARQSIDKLPWIESAEVRKVYPAPFLSRCASARRSPSGRTTRTCR
jgi:cell division protein FtsQ